MAMTQAEAAKLSNDMLLRGIIQTVVSESMVLQYLPFMEVVGTAVTFNREATNPAATWYDPGDTWTEDTPTTTQHTVALKILGGDADVDNFLQQTYSDTNDIRAEVIANRAKAVAYEFSDTFFNGVTTGGSKSFQGIHAQIPAGQTLEAGTNGAALDEDMIDELIDQLKGGKPHVLAMSKRTRRQLKALRRADGISMETQLNEYGQQVEFYDGIPIVVDDFISDTQTQGTTTGSTSSIYALRFGMDGVMGLQNGGITHVEIGDLETKDAIRDRIKWYCASQIFNNLGAAKLIGLTS